MSGRFGTGIVESFILGAEIAVVTTGLLVFLRWNFNPLLVAASIWLCVEAVTFQLEVEVLMQASGWLQESAFFLVFLIVGVGFVITSKSGLLPNADIEHRKALRY